MLAMLLQALWPALAGAQQSAAASSLEICTAQGMRSGAKRYDSGSGQPDAARPFSHCALCAAGAVDLPAIHQAALTVPDALLIDLVKTKAGRFAGSLPALHSSTHPRDPPRES